MSSYSVYIIECVDASLYTGITTDVERRLNEHLRGVGARYTKSHKPLRVIYQEVCGTRSAAQKREAEIKKLPRSKKKLLVRTGLHKRA